MNHYQFLIPKINILAFFSVVFSFQNWLARLPTFIKIQTINVILTLF